MDNQEITPHQPKPEINTNFESFESAADKLKDEFQDLFQDIPIYEEMEKSRLEFALDDEEFLTSIYDDCESFCNDIRMVMQILRDTFTDLNQNHGFSYQSIIEALKISKRVIYVSPNFVADKKTGDHKHVGLFVADDNQFVITYHLEPQKEIADEAKRIATSGLL